MQERLLWLAALIAAPAQEPTLAHLERAAALKTGTLKDAVRRRSVSKGLARSLMKAAPALGIIGLTTGWLIDDAGPKPRRGTIRERVEEEDGTAAEGTTQRRNEAGYLLRALTAQDAGLRLQVSEAGAGYADLAAIAANLAGQMLAERVAAIFRHTFEHNEIANTAAGRAFTIAFLEQVVEEFGALGLNVTDMARYVIELRRGNGPKK